MLDSTSNRLISSVEYRTGVQPVNAPSAIELPFVDWNGPTLSPYATVLNGWDPVATLNLLRTTGAKGIINGRPIYDTPQEPRIDRWVALPDAYAQTTVGSCALRARCASIAPVSECVTQDTVLTVSERIARHRLSERLRKVNVSHCFGFTYSKIVRRRKRPDGLLPRSVIERSAKEQLARPEPVPRLTDVISSVYHPCSFMATSASVSEVPYDAHLSITACVSSPAVLSGRINNTSCMRRSRSRCGAPCSCVSSRSLRARSISPGALYGRYHEVVRHRTASCAGVAFPCLSAHSVRYTACDRSHTVLSGCIDDAPCSLPHKRGNLYGFLLSHLPRKRGILYIYAFRYYAYLFIGPTHCCGFMLTKNMFRFRCYHYLGMYWFVLYIVWLLLFRR